MSHTFSQNLFHLVWSTKERRPWMPASHKDRIFEYLGGMFKTAGCKPHIVGGMSDHVHVLVGIPPKFAVSELVREVKVGSSKWINDAIPSCYGFAWQEGFGSFTTASSTRDAVYGYIQNQEKHHRNRSFQEEFVQLLERHGIEYDPRYLWKH